MVAPVAEIYSLTLPHSFTHILQKKAATVVLVRSEIRTTEKRQCFRSSLFKINNHVMEAREEHEGEIAARGSLFNHTPYSTLTSNTIKCFFFFFFFFLQEGKERKTSSFWFLQREPNGETLVDGHVLYV
jgi:hypothetical protein